MIFYLELYFLINTFILENKNLSIHENLPYLFDSFKLIQEQTTKSDDILHIAKKVTNRLYLSLCMIDQWSRNLFKFSILFSILFVWTEAFQPFQRRIYELTHGHTYKLTPIQPAEDTIFQETKWYSQTESKYLSTPQRIIHLLGHNIEMLCWYIINILQISIQGVIFITLIPRGF